MATPIKLGEILKQQGVITDLQLKSALSQQKQTGERLGKVLVDLKYITEQQLLSCLAKQFGLPIFDLKQYQVNQTYSHDLPEAYARLYRAIILSKDNHGYLLGIVDPLNLMAIDRIRKILKRPIKLALIREQELEHVLNLVYRRKEEIVSHAQALSQTLQTKFAQTETNLADAPIIKLIESLFEDAAQVNASDIHIDPTNDAIILRLRVDGILQEQRLKEQDIMPAIASRLKLMANLNIAEKRMPQDGRFSVLIKNKKFDIRLSTLPTPFGESIALRLLKQEDGIFTLENTGMSEEMLLHVQRLLHKPNGIILVTGPTGCGKSTTLYAALNEINQPGIQMITIEDPIEYYLPWAAQVQTNEKIGLDFACALRSILRHDPDVILVGEMRDKETASIAIRTALTGRLVFSTLHTNDTKSSITRLQDLGVESYLIASTIQAVIAQRLVRKICKNCAVPCAPTEDEKLWFSHAKFTLDQVDFFKGKGCSFCSNTGYHGRMGIFEILFLNEAIASALRNNQQQTLHQLTTQALKDKLLINDAYRLAKNGMTSLEEIMRTINEGTFQD